MESKAKPLGPHGLGDPDDTFLRKVELEILIPKKIREKAKREKCLEEVADFHKCALENGLRVIINCQNVNEKMKNCLSFWFHHPTFRKQCTEEYLKERSEFRKTGMRKGKVQ